MLDRGKQLEGLVALVEQSLLPKGFDVKTNTRVFNEVGDQLAEFDIEIRGRLGSTDIAWLIECRDRPSEGPAPGAWVEQLAGRRMRFGFNKVTAVSTTGFASGAVEFAHSQGIELREVRELSVDGFKDWFRVVEMTVRTRHAHLALAVVDIGEDEPDERKAAVHNVLRRSQDAPEVLCPSNGNPPMTLWRAFGIAVDLAGDLYADVEVGKRKPVKINARYTDDTAHFVIQTECGDVRVRAIRFEGEIEFVETRLPLALAAEYRRTLDGDVISQVAGFEPIEVHGVMRSIEMHRIPGAEQMQIVLRNLPKKLA